MSVTFIMLLTLTWQAATAQQYCPAPAFLAALSAEVPLGSVICESEDVALDLTVEGGFPLLGTAYAVSSGRLFQFDLDDPYGTAISITPNSDIFSGFFFTGGDLINGDFYVLDFFNNGLYTINLTTGVLNAQIGTTTPQVGERWSGLALDPTTGLAYALSKSNTNTTLYSLDFVNGAVTVIGSTGFGNGEWLAIDNDGNAFVSSTLPTVQNTLYSIDLATGLGTAIGPTVINSNSSAQSADFDPATGLQFNFAHQQFTNNRLFNLGDSQSGEFNSLQQQPTGQLVFTAFAIPGNQPALYNYTWSTGETTENITVNAAGTYTVSVTDYCGTEVVETITVSQDVQNTSTSCNANINTGLDGTGTAVVTPITVLEGENGCLEGYTVEIGNTGTNIADCSMIGQTYNVTVFDANGNTVCWNSGWTFEDKVDPIIQCTNLSLTCFDDTDPATMSNTGVDATDNCTTDPILTYTEVEDLGCMTDGTFGSITRTWTATDAYGNTSSCTQTLTITRPTLADLVCPENYDGMTNPVFACNGNWTQDDEGHPAPSETGEPTIDNNTLDNVCMFDLTYSDQVFPGCGDAYDVLRTWTVIDWCNTSDIETCVQTIKVMDNTPPTIDCPDNINENAGNNCNASVILPPPTLSDACSPDGLDYTIAHTAGTLVVQGTNNVLVGLELGITTVTYTATDGCGNTSECSFTITIADETAPPCVAITSTTLGLSASGTTIPWTTFVDSGIDLATADNCGPVTVEVKRQDMSFCEGDESTAYGLDVPFFCCDVTNVVLVDVKVTDGVGLENFCTVEVTIQDNLNPAITCPADKMISCENYAITLMVYDGVVVDADGTPDVGATSPLVYFLEENGSGTADDVTTFIGYYANASDNCDVTVTITDGFLQVDGCGNSENALNVDAPFVRTYTATDDFGNTNVCTQEITVYDPNPFDPLTDIDWPDEATVECSNGTDPADLPSGSQEPVLTETAGCDLVGFAIAQTDNVFFFDDPAPGDICYKILREWIVSDWCPDGVTATNTEYEQTIKVINSELPDISCSDDVTVDEGEDFTASASAMVCHPPVSQFDDGITYSYEIDYGADGTFEAAVMGSSLTSATGGTTGFTVGSHTIRFSAADKCGNVSSCLVDVTVINEFDCDDLSTTPYSINVGEFAGGVVLSYDDPALYNAGVSVPAGILISVDGSAFAPTYNLTCSNIGAIPVVILLEDFTICQREIMVEDQTTPSASCTDHSITIDPGSTLAFSTILNDLVSSVFDHCTTNFTDFTYDYDYNGNDFYTCGALGTQEIIDVMIMATDLSGNDGTCTSQVTISCGGPSPPMNIVTGVIGNEENGMLANVTVSPASGMDVVSTDENGAFSINLPTSENYDITPVKDDDYLNGVSTYDIVLISKHILGIQDLDSPYKIIAADINKSGSVTTLDMVLLRKIVLFIDLEFENNTSWRFVDANYVFDSPTEPFGELFPETYPINNLNSDMQDIDFVAVKTGDVNGTAVLGLNGAADERTFEGELQLAVDEQLLKAGETYKVDVKAKDFNDILGYQFTLGFEENAIEILDVIAGELAGLNADNFNMGSVSEGVITTSWNQQEAVSLDDNTVLFTLEVNAKQDVKLSDVLNTNSRLTSAEAYRESGADINLMNLAFEYSQPDTEAYNVFALYQNRPNPFKDETLISFSLPETGEVSLKVFDLSGKVVKEIAGIFEKGYNELSINRSDLNASGVLYYELSTSKHTALQKMIVID